MTFVVRRSAFVVQGSTFDVRRSAFVVHRSTFDVWGSTFGMPFETEAACLE